MDYKRIYPQIPQENIFPLLSLKDDRIAAKGLLTMILTANNSFPGEICFRWVKGFRKTADIRGKKGIWQPIFFWF